MRLDLILLMRVIYINSNLNPTTKFTSSSGSTESKNFFPWNISQMITKTVPISTRIVINYVMKVDISFWVGRKVNGNWDNNMITIFQWRKNHCRTNTSVRTKKFKCTIVRVTVWDLSWKVNYLKNIIRDT